MRFQGAVIREQGRTFAVVVVQRHVIDNQSTAADAIASFGPVFPGLPVVLMAQDKLRTPDLLRSSRYLPVFGQRADAGDPLA